jgi:hypothetical protein
MWMDVHTSVQIQQAPSSVVAKKDMNWMKMGYPVWVSAQSCPPLVCYTVFQMVLTTQPSHGNCNPHYTDFPATIVHTNSASIVLLICF